LWRTNFTQKKCHVLDSCSKAIEEDDKEFGQKCICISCQLMLFRITNKKNQNLNNVENWRGLESDTRTNIIIYIYKKNNLYYMIMKIPILSNDNYLKLKAINMKAGH